MAKATSFIQYLRGAARRIETLHELAPLPPNHSKYVTIVMVIALLLLMNLSYLIHARFSKLVQKDRVTFIPLEDSIGRVERSLIDLDNDLRGYAETSDTSYLLSYPAHRAVLEGAIDQAGTLGKPVSTRMAEIISELSAQSQRWVTSVADPLYHAASTSKNLAAPWATLTAGIPLLTRSRADAEEVRTFIAQDRESNQAIIAQVSRWLLAGVTLLGLLAIFCSGYLFDLARDLRLLYERAYQQARLAASKCNQLEAQLSFSTALVRHAPVAIGVVDIRTSVIRYANTAFAQMPFLIGQDLLDHPLEDVLLKTPETQPFWDAIRDASEQLELQSADRSEFRRKKDEDPTFWIMQAIPFGETENTKDHLMLLWQNTTPRTLAKLQLEMERTQALRTLSELRFILDNMSDGVIVTNGQNEASVINLHAREWLGAPVGLRLPQPLSVLTQDVSRQLDIKNWERRAAGASRGELLPSRISFMAGTSGRLVELVTTPIKKNDGQIDSVVSVLHDITEFKRAEKEKDDFLAVASHELKTPMTVLVASSQMITRALRDKDYPIIELLFQKMSIQLTRLKLLVSQLFDYASLQSGPIKISVTKSDLRLVVMKIIEESRFLLGERKIEVCITDKSLPVLIDEVRIEEVINNLLSNAIRYSMPEMSIRIGAQTVGKFAQVEISDQGIGIAEEDMPRVFEKFRRGANTSNIGGMGVGLYLSSEIVRAHGGRIWCESTGLGLGSTFRFELPLRTSS